MGFFLLSQNENKHIQWRTFDRECQWKCVQQIVFIQIWEMCLI